MDAIEDSMRTHVQEMEIYYTFDETLRTSRESDKEERFAYTFDVGDMGTLTGENLKCWHPPSLYNRMCVAAPNGTCFFAPEPRARASSFVYLDCGCWLDNADGKNASKSRRRNFGLVCGPHVYLCEFVRDGSAPTSRVSSVKDLFSDLKRKGCGVEVLKYARAKPPMAETTPTDPSLYIFLGDIHLPPVSWFYREEILDPQASAPPPLGAGKRSGWGALLGSYPDPPFWLTYTKPWGRNRLLYGNYYALTKIRPYKDASFPPPNLLDKVLWREPALAGTGDPDIFQRASEDLVTFINGICRVKNRTWRRRLIHFIQTGDMFEMWLGRKYQFQPGHLFKPRWKKKPESIDLVSDWALEIMIKHEFIFKAFKRLEREVGEVKFIWGNHDSYLMYQGVTEDQLKQPRRDPIYIGLKGDLFAEHGHRFDGDNYDNVTPWIWSGPRVSNLAYKMPWVRPLEELVRDPNEKRSGFLLGAELIYLYQKHGEKKNPFSIYVMGHSHAPELFTVNFQVRHEGQEVRDAGVPAGVPDAGSSPR